MKFTISYILLFLIFAYSAAAVFSAAKCAELAKLLETETDKCVTWFGLPPGKYNTNMNSYLDKEFLPVNGGTSVLNIIKANKIKTKGKSRTWWADISKIFAENASGDVRAVVGTPPPNADHKKTIFFTHELAGLTSPSSKVTSITAVSAADPTKTRVIWSTGMGHWGKGGADEAATPADIFEDPASSGCVAKRAVGGSCALPSKKKGSSTTAGKKPVAKTPPATGKKPVVKTPTTPGKKPVVKAPTTTGKKPVAKARPAVVQKPAVRAAPRRKPAV